MEKYESDIKEVDARVDDVFNFLSNMENIQRIVNNIPASFREENADKLKMLDTIKCTQDRVEFDAPMVGRMGIVVVEREENSSIKFGGDPAPLPFNVWIQVKSLAPYKTALKVTLKAEIPFMLRMMVSGKLKKGIQGMADMLSRLPYSALGSTFV